MKIYKIILASLIILGLSTCSTTSTITSEYKKGSSLDISKTYQLLKQEDDFSYGVNPIHQQYIESAITQNMMMLDYKLSSEPDLLVSYFVKEKLVQEKEIKYRGYYNQAGLPLWENVIEYEEGTLIIDLINQDDNKVIWHGAAARKISDKLSNAKAEENITKTVQSLLQRFDQEVIFSEGLTNTN